MRAGQYPGDMEMLRGCLSGRSSGGKRHGRSGSQCAKAKGKGSAFHDTDMGYLRMVRK